MFVSVVMPCLNEEKGVGKCVRAALDVISKYHISGEVIVADNGSTDRSVIVAKKAGARVVHAKERGYGAAYLVGLAEAKGDIFIIGDSDGTYDFRQIPEFLKKIKEGYDFVNGSRLKGEIAPKAFSFTHRYIGVPLLTNMLNLLFRTKFSDAHCGMRAFTREAYERMKLHSHGMEFASEMIVRAADVNLKSAEVPIRYLPRIGKSKLLSFRDAWRHIRFMLLFAPTFLFIIPGFCLLFLGLLFLLILFFGPFWIFGIGIDIHSMMFASTLSVLGMNILTLGLFAKLFILFGNTEMIKNSLVRFLINRFKPEDWLKTGLIISFTGFAISLYVFILWVRTGFGGIFEMRPVIVAMTFIILGTQLIFASFFANLLIDRYNKII